MADKADLKKNLDKISYVVGAIIAVVLIAFPFFLGGKVKDLTARVEDSTQQLNANKEKVQEQQVDGVDFETSRLDDLWTATGDSVKPRWNGHLKPGVLRVFNDEPPPEASHSSPCLTSAELIRDAESRTTYLQVSGTMSPDNKNVVIDKVILERRVSEGTWAEVKDFAEAGDFTYDDKGVQAGMKYEYRCTSVVTPSVVNEKTAILGAEDKSKTSNELLMDEAVPYDVALQIQGFGDLNKDPVERFYGSIKYWDYAAEKEVRLRQSTATTGWTKNFQFGEKIDEEGNKLLFLVRRITPETQSVNLLYQGNNRRETFKRVKGSKLRPTAGWEAVTHDCSPPAPVDPGAAGVAVPEGSGEKGTGAAVASPKTKPGPPKETPKAAGSSGTAGAKKKPTESGRRKRRGFGD